MSPTTFRCLYQHSVRLLTVIAFSMMTFSLANAQQAVPVSVKQVDGNWTLMRDGKPYQIKGAGGEASLKLLSQLGGNSGRVWGVDETTKARLDEAHKNGITVAVGLWLEHERHGFDYSDADAVEQQAKRTLDAVKQYKNHPAVLVWGVGNEMEGEGKNPAIWKHIEDICQRIKKEDPNHPTMCVIAEMGERKIQDMHQMCPSLDIIGINSYGGAVSVPQRYRENGGKKPYIVTEFGPLGTWEVGKNNIDAIDEPTSGAKAQMYRDAYASFAADQKNCLGSYAFIWGHKQEGTATWFGLLLPNGKKLAAVDALTELWTGKPPTNRCPEIESLTLTGGNVVQGEQQVEVKLKATDPENRILQTNWVLLREADQYVTGGDKQATPPDFSSAIKRSGPEGATLKMPTLGGLYRLYAYVDNGSGAATANIPLMVEGKALEEPGKKVKLPYFVYDDAGQEQMFSPSGWMGNTDALSVEDSTDNPKTGKTCLECQYSSTSGWGGVVWQHPESDWGDKAGGVDVSGATKLSFWVRGTNGQEKIKFGFGLIGRGKPYFDTAKKEMEVQLEKDWKKVTVDLTGMDLRRIKSGFFFSAASSQEPLKFYLDGIVFE
ncbi:MAG: glycoside hydrolase family 2 TIM barrel-domain containing protein [Planctomycetota bacterium]